MATIDIHDLTGAKVGTLDLADEIFGAVNEDLLWEAVKHYRAGQRAGTHATKNKKLVSGAGKKLWKQKGTGRARVGSIRSPLWRHGGTVHGPQPHSHAYTFPRKKLLGALRSALASKFADGKLIVVNTFKMDEPKSKAFREALDALKVDSTALIVEVPQHGNRNLELSSRNLTGVELVARKRSSSLSLASLRPRDFFAARNREAAAVVEEHTVQAPERSGRRRRRKAGSKESHALSAQARQA